ncbi:MAG: SLC13/DASS family transporter [bacterium]|nr:SLC13/DASS family transporter [bacterium]
MSQTNQKERFKKVLLVAVPLLTVLFILFFDLSPGRREITYTAAVAFLMAVWWITETVPLAVTALIPLILFPALGIMDGKTVSNQYVNHIIFIFVGGFMVALAMERWNLHKRLALRILMLFGVRPRFILMGFMSATALLSMWISNTATTMMMIPIAIAIVSNLEEMLGVEKVRKFSIGVFLGIAYSASIGGIATLIGTPPNLSFARIFNIFFPNAPEISFAQWFFFAFPISVVFLFIVWFLLSLFFCPRGGIKLDKQLFIEQYKALGPVSFEEKVVLVDFLLLVVLWMFRADILIGDFKIPGWSGLLPDAKFINDGTVSIAMAVILFLIPARNDKGNGGRVLTWKTVSKLPWNIVLLFGGGFALASGFKESGLSSWMGEQLKGLGSLHPVLIIACICIFITFLTELTSNTATAEILLPIMAALAVSINVNPLLLMIPGTLSCSFAFMLPVATPPNAIVFGTERLRVSDMARVGVILNLLGVIIITTAVFLIGKGVFGIDLTQPPSWMTP